MKPPTLEHVPQSLAVKSQLQRSLAQRSLGWLDPMKSPSQSPIFSPSHLAHLSTSKLQGEAPVMEDITNIVGGFLSHGGTPSHYPCYFGIFHQKPSSYWGIPDDYGTPLK